MSSKLDKTDLEILKLLGENGKITNLDLSEKIGLSTASTLERVKKLELASIISGYSAKINPSSVGLEMQCYLLISMSDSGETAHDHFNDSIQNIDGIVECHRLAGEYDYIVKVITKNNSSYEAILNKLGENKELGRMHTMVVLSSANSCKGLPLDPDQ